jgi:uncharacterized phage protein (predicted DNA packaging)
MPLLDDIKGPLRISVSTTAFDGEISDLIDAARQDLIQAGITTEKANDDTDPLIRRAVSLYVKANFGWDNPDADRLRQSFDLLKMHLSLASDYNGGAADVIP